MNIRKICLKLVIFLKLPPCEVEKKRGNYIQNKQREENKLTAEMNEIGNGSTVQETVETRS